MKQEPKYGSGTVGPSAAIAQLTAQPNVQLGGRPASLFQSEPRILSLTLYDHERDNKPSPRELTWVQLKAKYFSTHQVRKEKKGGMVFSPVSYAPGSTRKNENVIAVHCAVFDIEHHGPFDGIRSKLEGYSFAAYSSFSHRDADPRYRLVLPLLTPIPGNEWPLAWERLNSWMGGINDPSTKDASRIYYLPSRAAASTDYFIEDGEGLPVDIDQLPELTAETIAKAAVTKPKTAAELSGIGLKSADNVALNPASGLTYVLNQCKFMQETSKPEQQPTASRPLWMAMVSNASRFESSDDWIHESSRHHCEYDETITDRLIKDCRKFGSPITCTTIREGGFKGCPSKGCKTVSGKVTKAPAGLGARSNSDIQLPAEDVAQDALPNSYHVRNAPFFVSDQGIFKVRITEGEESHTLISSRIENLAETVDDTGGWGFLLGVKNPDGDTREWAMPRELLASSSSWRSVLLSMGADVYPAGKEDLLYEYLMSAKPQSRARSVAKPGWTEDAQGNRLFVLPNQVIGHSNDRIVFQSKDFDGQKTFGRNGDLDAWKQEVAMKCVGNSRLVMVVCAALAGAMLHLLGEENGGFHIVGPSSIGKTTAVEVAASVWGRRDLFVKSWRTTDNALESTAVRHNDTILILDEISQVNPAQAGEVAYMLGNGKGKNRADKSGSAKAVTSWRTLFLSTGEKSLSEHMEGANRQSLAGQEIRLLNLSADAGSGMGLFENIHQVQSPQQFATLIKRNTLMHYGVAGPAFVEALIQSASIGELVAQVRQQMSRFVDDNVPATASGQVKRVARRFALLAATGELAVELQILPWQAGEATRGAQACLQSWIGSLGSLGNQEADQAYKRGSNLHSLWDSGLIKYVSDDPEVWVNRLSSKPLPARVNVIDPNRIAEESCRIVATPDFYPDRKIEAPYVDTWTPVVEQQLQIGGARLATMLNQVFK